MAELSHFMTLRLSLGRRQLAVSFSRKRGRPKRISTVLRRLLENKKTRQIFGVNLMAVVFLTGVIAPPISAFTTNSEAEITTLSPTVIQLTTEDTIRVPVDSFNISQGYHLFHRAVDLNEITGAPVYPLMEGTVEEVVYGRSGYGNSVLINHDSGFKSLYAHLAKIIAAEGEEVDQNTVIGTVGHSGWATGSHLHLEVYDYGQTFNPLLILPAK